MAKKINTRKISAMELESRASHIGMMEAHGAHANDLTRKLKDPNVGSGRRSEFAKQIKVHIDASNKHAGELWKTANGPKKAESFSATDKHLKQKQQARNN